MPNSLLKDNKNGFLNDLYIKFNAPDTAKKTSFFRLLALSQKAGLWIRESLLSIRKAEKHPGLLYFIDDVVDQLTQWATFSDSLKNHMYLFKQEEIALIKSAESIGNLPQVLQDVSAQLESNDKITAKVKKASTYPIILLSVSMGAVVVLLIFVIPTVVWMFPPDKPLPGITIFMIAASDFLKARWFMLWFVAGWLYAAYNLSYKYLLPFKIFVDKLLITIPVVADVTKTFHMYRFSTILWQLYTWGISPVVSLHLISEIFTNYHYKKKVLELESDLKSWFSMAESMEWSDLFDPILIQIIHVGEETGNMADVLLKISWFYHDILGDKIDALLAMIEPIMMIFIAGIIGSVVGAVMIPMADMVNVMG